MTCALFQRLQGAPPFPFPWSRTCATSVVPIATMCLASFSRFRPRASFFVLWTMSVTTRRPTSTSWSSHFHSFMRVTSCTKEFSCKLYDLLLFATQENGVLINSTQAGWVRMIGSGSRQGRQHFDTTDHRCSKQDRNTRQNLRGVLKSKRRLATMQSGKLETFRGRKSNRF